MRLHMALAAIVLAFATQAHAQDEETRSIQAMLTECGFAPGPVDGRWGKKTEAAVVHYLTRHGETPGDSLLHDGRSGLIAKVNGYRAGDQGPCPADHEATGPVEQEEDVTEQSEIRKAKLSEKEAEIVTQISYQLDRQLLPFKSVTFSQEGILEVDDKTKFYGRVTFSDVESARPSYDNGIYFSCGSKGPCIAGDGHYHYDALLLVKGAYTPERDELVSLFNDLIALRQTQDSEPNEPQCYEWADLGSVSTGAWRNAYGHVAKGLTSGDLGKAWDRPELTKNYEASHSHCLPNGESAMRQAHSDMVVVGRHVTDVEDERRRIREYFQGKVKECQAEFTRRFEHYESRMCD